MFDACAEKRLVTRRSRGRGCRRGLTGFYLSSPTYAPRYLFCVVIRPSRKNLLWSKRRVIIYLFALRKKQTFRHFCGEPQSKLFNLELYLLIMKAGSKLFASAWHGCSPRSHTHLTRPTHRLNDSERAGRARQSEHRQ